MTDNENTISRLHAYILSKSISIYAFETAVGLSNGTFRKSLATKPKAKDERKARLSEKRAIGSDKIEKILSIYSDLNPIWLLTGNGSMLIGGDNEERAAGVVSEPAGIYTTLRDTKLPVPPERQFMLPISGQASAGYIVGYSDDEQYTYLDSYMLPLHKEHTIRAFMVKGDSMYPLLRQGDIVFCRRVLDAALHRFLLSHIYVVVCSGGIVVKHLDLGADRDIIRLVSANADYTAIALATDEVYEIWQAEGKYSAV